MKYKYCDSSSILAAWVTCTSESLEKARSLGPPQYNLPNPGHIEISGKDVTVYLRLTKLAAKHLADLLIKACEDENFRVLNDSAKPEGTYFDGVLDHDYGFFIHPLGSSVSIEVVDMPHIEELISDKVTSDRQTLTPDGSKQKSSLFKV